MSEHWGMELQLNLYNCEPEGLRSVKRIRKWIIDLCDLIGMRRYGEPLIVHFGDEPRVSGYSAIQLIETSNVSAHFAEDSNAIYINIFSCKDFDADKAAEFCKEFFLAEDSIARVYERK